MSFSIHTLEKCIFLSVFIFCQADALQANDALIYKYISQYKDLAISEMRRTGIPASIKMAQAIGESGIGTSILAIEANNHFGIKCGGGWNGHTYFKIDDDKDQEGNNVESCFRMYQDVAQSYMDHSDFLTDPAKSKRYGFLFQLSKYDYFGWAQGLKDAGYATDAQYASKLIQTIEKYKLTSLDFEKAPPIVFQEKTPIKTRKTEGLIANISTKTEEKNSNNINTAHKYSNQKSNKINGLAVFYAQGGESIKDVAKALRVDVYDLMEYNEQIGSDLYTLGANEIVFLERKKKFFEGQDDVYHHVENGQTLYDISQKYGVRLENLLDRNHLLPHTNPKNGERISINKHLSKNDAPSFVYDMSDRFLKLK